MPDCDELLRSTISFVWRSVSLQASKATPIRTQERQSTGWNICGRYCVKRDREGSNRGWHGRGRLIIRMRFWTRGYANSRLKR